MAGTPAAAAAAPAAGTAVHGGGTARLPLPAAAPTPPGLPRAPLHFLPDFPLASPASSASSAAAPPGAGPATPPLRSGPVVRQRAKLVSPVELDVADPNGVDTDGAETPRVIYLPPSGSFFCGRDHKSCHLWIADIHCSRQQAEILVDDKHGKIFITRYGQNPTKVNRGKSQFVLVRFEMFELMDGDMIVFPKEHAFILSVENAPEYVVGR